METTRKVVGMGETILDILFRNGQPEAAVHGGSTFNSIISVGRAGVPCTFVGYTGADMVGQQTASFLRDNGVCTDHFQIRQGEKSAVSLAFLADSGDANYLFYTEKPHLAGPWTLPEMTQGDVLLFGSYYAACHGMRPQITEALRKAAKAGAAVFYDLNFRPSHQPEREELMPNIVENLTHSTVVRGSTDDFEVLYASRDARDIYIRYVSPHCPCLICTAGAGEILVFTPSDTFRFEAPKIENVVSTVGAGDSFNAGFACALIWQGIMPQEIPNLPRDAWQRLIDIACLFAGETCRSKENYINYEKPHFNLNPFDNRTQQPG